MEIKNKERTGNTVKFSVSIDYKNYLKAFDEVIKEVAKRISIPGFRKGKAPKNVVLKNVDPAAVQEEAISKLLQSFYPEILKSADINPVDYPKLNVNPLKENQPIEVSFEIDVYPEVKLGKYKGLKLKKLPTKIGEEETTNFLTNLQNRLAIWHEAPEGEKAEIEDKINFKAECTIDGNKFAKFPETFNDYVIGSNLVSKDFDGNFIGLKIGEEKSFSEKFGKGAPIEEFKNKEVSFKVLVLKIFKKEVKPLDDSFAKEVSKFGSLVELKEEVKNNLVRIKNDEAEADLKNKIIKEVCDSCQVGVPAGMLKDETSVMFKELEDSLVGRNLTVDDYLKSIKKTKEEFEKDLTQPATLRAKGKIVLKAIAEKEKLELNEQDIEDELMKISQMESKTLDEIKKELAPSAMAFIKEYLLREKALSFIIENAKVKEEGG
jgi:trigger factor